MNYGSIKADTQNIDNSRIEHFSGYSCQIVKFCIYPVSLFHK